MNGFIKHFLTFSTVLAVCFGAYSFLQETPKKALEKVDEAEEALRREIASVKETMEARRAVRDAEIKDIQRTFDSKLDKVQDILLKRIDTLDERWYKLYTDDKERAARAAAAYDNDGG